MLFGWEQIKLNIIFPIIDNIIVVPIRVLFLQGPALLGCWGGRDIEDICTQLTNTPSSIWVNNMIECQAIVDTNFMTFLVTAESILYFISLYKCGSILFQMISRKCLGSGYKPSSPRVIVHVNQPQLPHLDDAVRLKSS